MTATQKLLLDVNDVAEALSMPRATIREWERTGAMPRRVEVNGQRRWIATDIERWVETRRDER
jgi:predicted DNA-binding transcriptional regulator AlpA